jgi:hypothetical protein
LQKRLFDHGEEQAVLTLKRSRLDELLAWIERERSALGVPELEKPGDIGTFTGTALLAHSLGERELVQFLLEPVERYLGEGRYHWGGPLRRATVRAIIHVSREDFPEALRQYEIAFEHGLDVEGALRQYERITLADRRLDAFYYGEGFQALVERSNAYRARAVQTLAERSPQLLDPDLDAIIERVESAVEEWRVSAVGVHAFINGADRLAP